MADGITQWYTLVARLTNGMCGKASAVLQVGLMLGSGHLIERITTMMEFGQQETCGHNGQRSRRE